MPDYRQQTGQICETILSEWLLRQGYYVFRPLAGQGPVDVIACNEDGDIHLFDAKSENRRVNPSRKAAARIYRPLKDAQKKLGVRIAYVNFETREIHIVPPLDEE